MKYNVDEARVLALQGLPFAQICKRLGWEPRNAKTPRQVLMAEGVLVGFHSDEYATGNMRGGAKRRRKPADAGAEEVPMPHNDAFSETGGTWTGFRISDNAAPSLADIVTMLKADLDLWEVDTWNCGFHQMGSMPRPTGSTAEGWESRSTEAIITPLYKISAKFIRNHARKAVIDTIAALIAKMDAHSPVYLPQIYTPRSAPGFMLEPAIFDTHLGKLAWAEESGFSYDLKIAEARYDDAMNEIIHSAARFDIDRIMLPLGHDYFHVDGRENKTAHGTVVTADSRQQKVFRLGCEILVRNIDRLRLIAPVDVVMIPGNHDLESVFSLGEYLRAWYRKDSCVNIDNRAAVRKYYEYGQVMLQLMHGSEETTAVTCAELAAGEQKEMWGRTTYRETHQGHRHKSMGKGQTKVKYQTDYDERLGYTVRIIRALSEQDDWHFGKAFVENIQGAEHFIWSAERGLKAHEFYTVPNDLKRAA